MCPAVEYAWVSEHLGAEWMKRLIITCDKTLIHGDLLIDDKHFYRAMLYIRGTSHGPMSVSVSVCLSQVGVLLKRLNVGSHKQHHTIAQGL